MKMQMILDEPITDVSSASEDVIRDAITNDLHANMQRVNVLSLAGRSKILIATPFGGAIISIPDSIVLFDYYTPDLAALYDAIYGDNDIPDRFKGCKRFKFWYNKHSVMNLLDKAARSTELHVPEDKVFSD